jgi:hypothetical protein
MKLIDIIFLPTVCEIFTIPYIIGAILYCVSFFMKIRNANKCLQEIKQGQ